MFHINGKAISSKTVHQKMTVAILQPADRDRAGAHSNVALMELTQRLKDTHGLYLSGNVSSWAMWANAIHLASVYKQENMVTGHRNATVTFSVSDI